MKLHITIILILNSIIVQCQDFTPLDLVQRIFGDTAFVKEIPLYSTGEYGGSPNSLDIVPGSKLEFRILAETEKNAVINMTLTDSVGQGIDTYIHLVSEEVWKIEAVRALAMTGILAQLKNEFESLTANQIDSLVSVDDMFETKEDFYRELGNISLTLELDDEIISHFIANRKKFEFVLGEIIALGLDINYQEFRSISLSDSIKCDYSEVLINGISTSLFCADCIEFTIGGMIDNTVGYIYIPNTTDVPKMNPDRLIMIREIGNGWYIFKTT